MVTPRGPRLLARSVPLTEAAPVVHGPAVHAHVTVHLGTPGHCEARELACRALDLHPRLRIVAHALAHAEHELASVGWWCGDGARRPCVFARVDGGAGLGVLMSCATKHAEGAGRGSWHSSADD